MFLTLILAASFLLVTGWMVLIIFLNQGVIPHILRILAWVRNQMSPFCSCQHSCIRERAPDGPYHCTPYTAQALREQISCRFSISEIRTLLFDLTFDYDELPGETKSDKVRELVLWAARTDQLIRLIALLKKERPTVTWPSTDELVIIQRGVVNTTPGHLPLVGIYFGFLVGIITTVILGSLWIVVIISRVFAAKK